MQADQSDQPHGDAGLEPVWVRPDVVASWLGVSRRWVFELAREGVMTRNAEGQYDLIACVRARLKQLEEYAEAKTPDQTANAKTAAQVRLMQQQAEREKSHIVRIGMDVAERKRSLVEHDAFIAVVDSVEDVFMRGIGKLPLYLKGLPDDVIDRVEVEANTMRKNLRQVASYARQAQDNSLAVCAVEDVEVKASRGRGRPPKDRSDFFTPSLI